MREVQATVAETRLSEMLRYVERGETIAITHNGAKVAALVSIDDAERLERARAMDRFRLMRAKLKPTGMTRNETKSAKHEGHRW